MNQNQIQYLFWGKWDHGMGSEQLIFTPILGSLNYIYRKNKGDIRYYSCLERLILQVQLWSSYICVLFLLVTPYC